MQQLEPMARDRRLQAGLFSLLLGVYLLVYIPRVDSIDGQAILAVSASLARTGTFQIGQIGAQDSLLPQQMARMGAFGLDGGYYAKKGVTPSLLLVPLVWLADALRLDLRPLAMVFNPVVTALTGVTLYSLVRALGYSARTGIFTALLYGLATFALVYTKTLYAEPLAALLLTIAIQTSLRRSREAEGQRKNGSASLLLCPSAVKSGLFLGLLMGINLVYAVLVPLVVVWKVIYGRTAVRPYRQLVLRLCRFLLPVLLCAGLIAVYNLARFGSLTSTGYHFAAGEGFTRPFVEGFLGQFISPYRGLLWYNPVLLLALPGWLMLRRARPDAAWLLLGLIGVCISAFATWWSWEGGIAWGARFTLTITPLVAACLAPLMEVAWSVFPVSGSRLPVVDANLAVSNPPSATGDRKLATGNPRLVAGSWWLVALPLVALTILSFGIQLFGAGYSLYPFVEYLYRFGNRAVLYDPLQSAVIGHLALARAGWPFEPAWIADGLNAPHFLLTLLVIGFGAVLILFRTEEKKLLQRSKEAEGQRIERSKGSRLVHFLSAALLLCLSAVTLLLLARLYTRPESPIAELNAALTPPGRVLIASTHFDESVLDLPLHQTVISTNAPTAPDDTLAVDLTRAARHEQGNLWLVTWFAPAAPENWQERDLWACCAFGLERNAAGHRALLFNLALPPGADQPLEYIFGEQARLTGYGVQRVPEGMLVTLAWLAGTSPAAGLNWFAHMLDADGNIIAQQDRAPGGGYQSLIDWQANEPLLDYLYFPGVEAAAHLRLGWVNPTTGERLPVMQGGEAVADGFILLSVNQ
jgi:hypothetical protein